MSKLRELRQRLNVKARALGAHLLYERRFRLNTEGDERLSWHGGDLVHYEPIAWRRVMRWIPPDSVDRGDVLLDAGCGKGRIVFVVARHYDIGRVLGIELSPELFAIAQRNIDRNRRRLRCRDVELVQADARTWPIPDDVTIVTLFNPFIGEAFRDFIGQLLASVERRPRTLRLLYVNAKEQAMIEATGRFRLLASDGYVDTPTGDPAVDGDVLRFAGVRLYELAPSASGG